MKHYYTIVFTFIATLTFAQNNKQNIRGLVLDKLTQSPIQGAAVHISNSNKTTISDSIGNYTFSELNPGRYDLKVTYSGYKESYIPNVVVTSGKEIILDIGLEEDFKSLKDVVVKSSNKASSINKMATVSARTFSMEEVNRYAGGRSDPARLAANFAGVINPDDSRNDIVIRGNSPTGVLWKIDGMNVTNPNHFASIGTTGGAVSALNTNLLKSSDFFTSAFPAEYGNANAGVFDIGFRNGNNTKKETTLQLGVITGLEATTEGPIKKDNGSSYLVGYRYSLAGIAQSMGINIGTTATPSYQDLSFKLNSGTTKMGKFSLFGIYGTSTIALESRGDKNSLYGNGNQADFSSKLGTIGLNHFKQINSKSYISSTIGLNYSKNSPSTPVIKINDIEIRGFEDPNYYDNLKKIEATDPFLYGVTFETFSASSPQHGNVKGVLVLAVQQDSNVWQADLRPGDIITVERDARAFTALGATGSQSRVPFETETLSAIEAIAIVDGLNTSTADPTGVFVFRNEPAEIANAVLGRKDLQGDQRMIYVLDLTQPTGMFEARDFLVRDGDTLHMEVEITFAAASLGTKISVETLDGQSEIAIKAGTQTGSTVALKGHGMTRLRSNSRGDLIVHVVVMTPTKLSREQEKMLNEFAKSRGETAGGSNTKGKNQSFLGKFRDSFGR